MLKRFAVIFMALVIASFSLTACESGSSENGGSQDTSQSSSQTVSADETAASSETALDETAFAEGDLRDVTSEEPNATIELSGTTGTISDTTRGTSGSDVTITSKGIYKVTGTSENVSIIVNDEKKSGNIYIVLDNVSMTNSEKPCIIVENSEKVIIVTTGKQVSSLTYTCENNADGYDGAIYSEDDLTFSGSGMLTVDSSLHGVVCKDDLKIVDSVLVVSASSIGIKAGDSVRIGGGSLEVNALHDGIRVENKDGTSFFYMEDGSFVITAGYDGIDVGTSDADFTGSIKLLGGSGEIYAGGGAENAKGETSQKGIKCDGDIIAAGIDMTVSSPDDAVHGNGSVTVGGGALRLLSSDDAITAKGTLTITDGTIDVQKSYEALEGSNVNISGGEITLVSSDDGINAGGGSDTSASDDDTFSSSSGDITISGGSLYIDSSGDGIDSNGSIYITGGEVIIEGASDSGNGALDKGDGSDCVASISGGTVLALGYSNMAENFDSGSQCSALVELTGSEGTEISVDDGSGFTFTATKSFETIVYSSPSMKQGEKYTITAGESSAKADFSSGLYSPAK